MSNEEELISRFGGSVASQDRVNSADVGGSLTALWSFSVKCLFMANYRLISNIVCECSSTFCLATLAQ